MCGMSVLPASSQPAIPFGQCKNLAAPSQQLTQHLSQTFLPVSKTHLNSAPFFSVKGFRQRHARALSILLPSLLANHLSNVTEPHPYLSNQVQQVCRCHARPKYPSVTVATYTKVARPGSNTCGHSQRDLGQPHRRPQTRSLRLSGQVQRAQCLRQFHRSDSSRGPEKARKGERYTDDSRWEAQAG